MSTAESEQREVVADLYRTLRVLSERIWERRAQRGEIDGWLANFSEELEAPRSDRFHMLYLLSQFVYFGEREVKELLRALYRDHYRYPIIDSLRRANGDTTDATLLNQLFSEELRSTRFLGIGNPAESGTHLLYHFRQENRLATNLFVTETQLVDRRFDDPKVGLSSPEIRRIVFLDDFCGSGTQAKQYSQKFLQLLRDIASRSGTPLHLSYLVMMARKEGLESVRAGTEFDAVDAVFELDESYRCLEPDSRHFRSSPKGIDRARAKEVALDFGSRLWPTDPLGYKDGQLLLGFHHNVPDNTLPVIWWQQDPSVWTPIFPRHHKIYGHA